MPSIPSMRSVSKSCGLYAPHVVAANAALTPAFPKLLSNLVTDQRIFYRQVHRGHPQ
jgi:hypothetical protein